MRHRRGPSSLAHAPSQRPRVAELGRGTYEFVGESVVWAQIMTLLEGVREAQAWHGNALYLAHARLPPAMLNFKAQRHLRGVGKARIRAAAFDF